MVDDTFGHWFAGLVDGEGCFHARAHIRKRDGAHCLVVYFSLKLRADDKPMLEMIRETLGIGYIYTYEREKLSIYPQSDYRIAHRKELKNVLIPVFDQYPLRSKKVNDYQVWRRIVLECKCASRRHCQVGVGSLPNHIWDKAVGLCNLLREQREFEIDPDVAETARQRVRQTQPPLFVPEPQQMEMEGI